MLRWILETLGGVLAGVVTVLVMWAMGVLRPDSTAATLVILIVMVAVGVAIKLERMEKKLSAIADKLAAASALDPPKSPDRDKSNIIVRPM
jgi:hypothetical protein